MKNTNNIRRVKVWYTDLDTPIIFDVLYTSGVTRSDAAQYMPQSVAAFIDNARRNYLTGTEFGTPAHTGGTLRTEVSNAEVWCECFGKSLQELKPSDSYGIAAMMSQIPGWERTERIRRQPLYGRQRLYALTYGG